ncbi:cation transporter [Salicibibacter cibi]|uniref:Cation transporter n=1 Tax=Salicibibacter cibi TaxID=2743001 RepID=A0A7T6ZAR5_9BACI|nr:cation transporter [Salicibibacter cibi]QQK80049.1 cation transporter [Salicibibacter cibi]
MSCGHCANSIEGSVGKMNGVKTVKVDVNNINEGIEEQGYDVA